MDMIRMCVQDGRLNDRSEFDYEIDMIDPSHVRRFSSVAES